MKVRVGSGVKFIASLLAICGHGIFSSASAAPEAIADSKPATINTSSPRAEVAGTINEIINIVEELPGANNTKARRDKLRVLINPRFDFGEMARRSLGAHWATVTPAEQEEFVSVFSDLLARTYLARIETVERGMVKIDGEKVEYPKAIVKTTVTNKGDEFPIDYKLLDRKGQWMVYDVVIENIGLVANYRNEFAGIIRKEKFEGLLRRLRNKNKSSA